MTAAASSLLAELNHLGVELVAEGERLRYRPRQVITADMATRMKAHKAELLALLAQTAPARSSVTFDDAVDVSSPADLPMDWRIEFEERAAILEYDGGLSRDEADEQALHEIVERLKRIGEAGS